MFLPSGRVHALGAGLVIFEIQQNSDTTYRVFDWNRVGLDGQPRELHVAQSLASIDFNDLEPALVQSKFNGGGPIQKRPLVHDPLFQVEAWRMKAGAGVPLNPGTLQIIAGLSGRLEIQSDSASVKLSAGRFCLVPACLERTEITAQPDAAWLLTEAG